MAGCLSSADSSCRHSTFPADGGANPPPPQPGPVPGGRPIQTVLCNFGVHSQRTSLEKIQVCLQGLDVFMAGDDVPKKKPDPSIYKIATERLRVSTAPSLLLHTFRRNLCATFALKHAGRCSCLAQLEWTGVGVQHARINQELTQTQTVPFARSCRRPSVSLSRTAPSA